MENIQNYSLAELLDRDQRRREELDRHEREQRDQRRSQTEENTLSNSGVVILKLFVYFLNN